MMTHLARMPPTPRFITDILVTPNVTSQPELFVSYHDNVCLLSCALWGFQLQAFKSCHALCDV